jgi:hypothetical protein
MIQLRAAANSLSPLQHKRLQPAFREVTRRDQAVVTTTDDYDIVFGHLVIADCQLPIVDFKKVPLNSDKLAIDNWQSAMA